MILEEVLSAYDVSLINYNHQDWTQALARYAFMNLDCRKLADTESALEEDKWTHLIACRNTLDRIVSMARIRRQESFKVQSAKAWQPQAEHSSVISDAKGPS